MSLVNLWGHPAANAFGGYQLTCWDLLLHVHIQTHGVPFPTGFRSSSQLRKPTRSEAETRQCFLTLLTHKLYDCGSKQLRNLQQPRTTSRSAHTTLQPPSVQLPCQIAAVRACIGNDQSRCPANVDVFFRVDNPQQKSKKNGGSMWLLFDLETISDGLCKVNLVAFCCDPRSPVRVIREMPHPNWKG